MPQHATGATEPLRRRRGATADKPWNHRGPYHGAYRGSLADIPWNHRACRSVSTPPPVLTGVASPAPARAPFLLRRASAADGGTAVAPRPSDGQRAALPPQLTPPPSGPFGPRVRASLAFLSDPEVGAEGQGG